MAGRPPIGDPDEAFRVYVGDARGDVTRTAELLGMSRAKVYEWRRRYQWDERIGAELTRTAEPARTEARALIKVGTRAATRALLAIIEDDTSKPSDVIRASELLFRYGLTDGEGPSTVHNHLTVIGNALDAQDITQLDSAELHKLSSGLLAGNVTEVRKRKGT